MKKIVLVFTFLITISVQLNAQWFWQNPLPQGNKLSSVFFVDNTDGWAVGNTGIILNTSDGGNNWVLQLSGTKEQLLSVCFIDKYTGWAVGGNYQGVILKTTNGGQNWFLLKSSNEAYNSVFFH